VDINTSHRMDCCCSWQVSGLWSRVWRLGFCKGILIFMSIDASLLISVMQSSDEGEEMEIKYQTPRHFIKEFKTWLAYRDCPFFYAQGSNQGGSRCYDVSLRTSANAICQLLILFGRVKKPSKRETGLITKRIPTHQLVQVERRSV